MKKRFASFILTGKAATLPLISASALADKVTDNFSNPALHILEGSTQTTDGVGVIMDSLHDQASDANGSGGATAANVYYPGTACTSPAATTMNVVVTGLKSGEDVFIFKSTQKDDPSIATAYPGLRVGSDFEVLAKFTYSGSTASNAVGNVSIPLDMAKLGITSTSTIHLQAAAGLMDAASGTYSGIRFSELDEIKSSVKDCSYTDGVDSGTSY